MKGMKKRADENKRRYIKAEEQVEFLKWEIEKLQDEIDKTV